jgi:hypothetical protein
MAPGPGAVTPKQIWLALIGAGASPAQAAGIMGNMWFESSLNPESHAMDSNGKMAYGLVSWNAGSYPNASSLVTGNALADLGSQVKFLVSTGGLKAAQGSTAQQSGSNFAANYERCQGCQSGGQQNQLRSAKAAAFFAAAKSGKWPTSGGSGSGGSGGAGPGCFIAINDPASSIPVVGGLFPSGCLMSKSQARAVLGTLILTSGGGIMMLGVLILAAYGLKSSGAGKAAGRAMEGAAGVAAVASPEAGAAVRAGSARVRGQARPKPKPRPKAKPAARAPAAKKETASQPPEQP